MTDKTTNGGDEEEIVAIELDSDGKEIAPADGGDAAAALGDTGGDTDDDDADGEDSRLATSEDDSDDEISRSAKQRRQRRERRKRAEQMSRAELAELRELTRQQAARLAALEGHQVQQTGFTLQQQYQQKMAEVQQAEHVFARATEAGNGDDAAAALRLRDAARDEANRIAAQYRYMQAQQQGQQPGVQPTQQQAPQVDPATITYAREWAAANPWYDPAGRDPDSKLVMEIDAELAREGFKSNERSYWTELTRRVAAELDDSDDTSTSGAAGKPRRTGPPVGASREHAPSTTRKEIRVTPERKKAMIEAGAWDDPVKRQRMLKAYRDYDNQQSAR